METAGPACVMMPGSDLEIPIRPVTQKEYGHFMVLFNAVDQVYDPDGPPKAVVYIWTSAQESSLVNSAGSRSSSPLRAAV